MTSTPDDNIEKVLRRVRTQEGAKRYGVPVGSIIDTKDDLGRGAPKQGRMRSSTGRLLNDKEKRKAKATLARHAREEMKRLDGDVRRAIQQMSTSERKKFLELLKKRAEAKAKAKKDTPARELPIEARMTIEQMLQAARSGGDSKGGTVERRAMTETERKALNKPRDIRDKERKQRQEMLKRKREALRKKKILTQKKIIERKKREHMRHLKVRMADD